MRSDDDFRNEIEAHIALETERLVADGLPPEEARAAALRKFGNVTGARERFHESRRGLWLEDLWKDVGYALRSLRRSPGFACVAIVTLALGIGATTTVFGVVKGVLLRPLPFAGADRMVTVVENVPARESFRGVAMRTSGMNQEEFDWWRRQSKTLDLAVTMPETRTFMTSEGAVRLFGARVSPNLFQMLGVPPILGRGLRPDEERPDATVVVLSVGTWRQYFGSDPDVVNREMVLDGQAYTIVGVMPQAFGEAAFWTPYVVEPAPRGGVLFIAVAYRLREGVTLEAAAAEANVLGHRLRGIPAEPGQPPRFEVVRNQDQAVARVRPALRVLVVAVVVVLLIMCANVANLLLARATKRQQEIGIRMALGAGRPRIIRQLLTESIVLAGAGAAGGALLAYGGIAVLKTIAIIDVPQRFRGELGPAMLQRTVLPRVNDVAVDTGVLAFALGVAVLTGIAFGLAPSIRLSRASVRATNPFGPTLAVTQLTLATTLLIGAGLLTHSFVKLSTRDLGFDQDVLNFQLVTPGDYSPDRKLSVAYGVADRLRLMPGVRDVGFVDTPPLSGSDGWGLVAPPGRVWREIENEERSRVRGVSPGYLQALGIRLVEGRWLDARDLPGRTPSVLVSRAYARHFFGGRSPVGSVLTYGTLGAVQVVGVVENFKLRVLEDDSGIAVFLEPRQAVAALAEQERFKEKFIGGSSSTLSFAVRADVNPSVLAPVLRRIIREVDAAAAAENVMTMEHVIDSMNARPRFYAVVLGVFGAMAGLLAAVGIYGVLAYGVTQRTREIGIRLALGGTPREVLGLVMKRGAVLVATGIAGGLTGATGLTRYLEGMLFGLTPLDAGTYAIVAASFAAVAMIASFVPARRASRLDPLIALRHE